MVCFVSVFARDDTLLGGCAGLAEDFGFDPLWPRALFAIGLFLSPEAAVATYAGCVVLVAASRWLVPDAEPTPIEAEATPDNDDECQAVAWEDLARAA